MTVWKLFVSGILISGIFGAVGILAAMSPARPEGYPLDGRLDSMTPDQLQRAIAHLGLDARSFTYDISKKHVLRVDVEDYRDGKRTQTVLIGRHTIPHVGRQTFMIFSDSRDNDNFVLSEEFLSPTDSAEAEVCQLLKPKKGWGTWWNDRAILKVGEKAPLYYIIDLGGKKISFPMPVEKMVAEYPRVIVVYATLESEEK
jgi:hypothetical protein